jgi:NADPH:quinone reductase-like Zn-dependent oxidoreductase
MTRPAAMRAWRVHQYGGPERLQLDTVPLPALAPGYLLVKVTVASVNPIDWKTREGYLARAMPIELPRVLGRDCAGTVVESGSAAFDAGERVLAVGEAGRDGGQAEYALVPAASSARVPASVSLEESIAFGIAGTSAWIPLVEIANIGRGKKVLVHAGAGGVGSVAVQLARHFGADVLATCGTANLAFVESLGARPIDYTREDFVAAAGPCDVVFDTVGGEVHRRSYAALKPGGLLVYLNAAPIPAWHAPRADVRVVLAQIRVTTERLERQLELAARGVIRGQVGAVFRFEEAVKAYDLVQTGHARGKVMIKMG